MLYKNTRVASVRFVQIFLWIVTLGSAVLMFAESFGGAPGSWAVGAILAPIFGLCALGMEFYLRCYVTALEEHPQGIRLETLSTLGRVRKIVPWANVKLGGSRADVVDYLPAPIVNNQYSLLRIKGRRIPIIIDTTEDDLDEEGLREAQAKAQQ